MVQAISDDADITLFAKIKETGSKGFLYSIGAFLQRSTSIILLPVYAAYLQTEAYGAYSLLITTLYFMDTLFSLGLRAGLIRSYYDYKSKLALDELVSTVFWLTAGMSILPLIMGLFLSGWVVSLLFASHAYHEAFQVLLLLLFIGLYNQLGLTLLRARRAARRYVVIQFGTTLLRIGLILWFIIGLNKGVLAILMAYFISALFLLLLLILQLWSNIKFRFSIAEARKMLDFGLPLMIAGLSGFVSTYIDRYIINYYTSLTEVGIYTLAYQLAMIISLIIIYPFQFIWAPTFLSVKDRPFMNDFCAKILTYLLMAGGFLALMLSLLAGDFIRLFTRPEYIAACPLIPILVFTYFLWSSRPVIEVAMVLKRKTKFIAVLHILGALLNTVLNIILIPRYNLAGAAWATAATFSAILLVDYFYNQHIYTISYEWGRIGKILVIIVSLFLLGWHVHFQEVLYSLSFKFMLLLSYPILFFVMRFFRHEELRYLKDLLYRIPFKNVGKAKRDEP
jgi:O-antigen/teichoic acid export membrane protein